jgi:TolA-binding protein
MGAPARTATPASGLGTPATARGVEGVPASPGSRAPEGVAAFDASAAEAPDEGTLRAETALLEQALAALKHGDLAAARRELARHAAQFPNGHLAPERERALARIREKERTP